MESVRERMTFLGMEWSLILGWLATILLIWRQTIFYLLVVLFDLGDTYDLVFTLLIFLLMIVAGVAVTATGFWLKRRPRAYSLTRRWAQGWAWIGMSALLGYLIIVIPGGVFAP
jgi:hypothetical protein